jgi:tripartite-type tricarboxylate transporter receptor subunit TctC
MMRYFHRLFLGLFLGLVAYACSAQVANAQKSDYPTRSVKVIVPFSTGSGADHASRFFGDLLAKHFGQNFLVENKTGAGGVLAMNTVKAAPADGYTILMGSNSLMAVNPIMLKELSYDAVKDFKPIGGLTRGLNVIVVAQDSKYQSFAELLAAAKASAVPLNGGTYALGYQLALAWLANVAGVKFENIAYKGAGEIMVSLLGNQLDFGIVSFNGAVPLLKAGKFKALALSSDKRHPDFPDVPTIAESGFPEFTNYTWTSFFVRSDTPADITNKLEEALQTVIATPLAKEYADHVLVELLPYKAEAMRRYQLEEIARFTKIAKEAGLEPK